MGDSSVSFQQSALKHAAVYPTKIDKQKVGLVLNVFCDYTSAALINSSIACESFTDTARLIQLVVALWKLLNCKHRFQHLRFNDPDRVAITGPDCPGIAHLSKWANAKILQGPTTTPH